jgi:hypothetical protein
MRRTDDDDDWHDVCQEWAIRADTTYLNHGSFGPPPRAVCEAREHFRRELDGQPMDSLCAALNRPGARREVRWPDTWVLPRTVSPL